MNTKPVMVTNVNKKKNDSTLRKTASPFEYNEQTLLNRINERQIKKDLSNTTIQKRLGCSKTAWYYYKNGKRKIPIEILVRLTGKDLLDCSIEYLLGIIPHPTKEQTDIVNALGIYPDAVVELMKRAKTGSWNYEGLVTHIISSLVLWDKCDILSANLYQEMYRRRLSNELYQLPEHKKLVDAFRNIRASAALRGSRDKALSVKFRMMICKIADKKNAQQLSDIWERILDKHDSITEDIDIKKEFKITEREEEKILYCDKIEKQVIAEYRRQNNSFEIQKLLIEFLDYFCESYEDWRINQMLSSLPDLIENYVAYSLEPPDNTDEN